MKGGYQIIDLKNNDFNLGPATIKGSYLKATTGKAILFENMTFGTIKIGAAFLFAEIMEDGTVTIPITISTGSAAVNMFFTVSDEDVITFNQYQGE